MSLFVPAYKKIKYSKNVVVTRSLPRKGDVVVKPGDNVMPFTKVGRAKISNEIIAIPKNVKLMKDLHEGSFVYSDDPLGKISTFKKFNAPFNGTLRQENDRWFFYQEERDVWVLAGVWGKVVNVDSKKHIEIETQAIDINLVAFTEEFVMGELVVFPNPSELLDLEYLQNFSKNSQNKIVYVGNHIRRELLEKAIDLKMEAIIGGSIHKKDLNYAQEIGLPIGITTGFGNLNTPKFIFDFLKTISNRHVFIDGKQGILRVPMPEDNNYKEFMEVSSDDIFVELKEGLTIMVFDKNYFGATGVVKEVKNDIVYVKLDKPEEVIESSVPNILALS